MYVCMYVWYVHEYVHKYTDTGTDTHAHTNSIKNMYVYLPVLGWRDKRLAKQQVVLYCVSTYICKA